MVLEGVEELAKDLVLRLFARFDVWVLLGIIRLSDVVDVELAGLVGVHNLICLHSDRLSELIHLTTNGP